MRAGDSLALRDIFGGKFQFCSQSGDRAQYWGQPHWGERCCKLQLPPWKPLCGTREAAGDPSSQAALETWLQNERSNSTEGKGGKEFCGFHPCPAHCQNIQTQLAQESAAAAGGSHLALAETCRWPWTGESCETGHPESPQSWKRYITVHDGISGRTRF